MKRARAVSVAMVGLAGLAVTLGAPQARPSSGGSCAGASTTVAMSACAEKGYREADRELNRLYRAILERLDARAARLKESAGAPGGTKALFVSAQRSWLVFRDRDCAVQAKLYEGGTYGPVARLNCLSAHTSTRAKDLAALLEEVSR